VLYLPPLVDSFANYALFVLWKNRADDAPVEIDSVEEVVVDMDNDGEAVVDSEDDNDGNSRDHQREELD